MKHRHLFGLLLLILLTLSSCGKNQSLTPPDDPDIPVGFGTDSTLDIISWNLKEFPMNDNTIPLLVDIIPTLDADVIAFQEIMDASLFFEMAQRISGYQGLVYNYNGGWKLAYLYKTESITVNSDYIIFPSESRPFPRPPYVLDLEFGGTQYFVINNHFKALGDNTVDHTDPWDEEMRRIEANTKLEEYIRQNHSTDKLIVLGDLNDQIQEDPVTNVFMAFLDRPQDYYFTTMPIAQNPSPDTVSYPRYNSMIDHILITDELFADFEASGSVCIALQVEQRLGGLSGYYDQVSDHRPVGIRLEASQIKSPKS
ncbi:MAG: endonuclease/exonuclease/phosphatase family protein [Candidatus Cloacimonetes bacterium]|jgi:exonuclease III|nr:endonuclease/exonuclease/phosphatase family protein [Candidatus Cloacimonadota bacterium]MDD2507079.1 endonuclease/exonuclease/phosphatase family protein [Candidatus Cloacimonadota bacterium]MDD4147108.1 endonuclease/exonuclease/phosphatase family protein [Candidatus Cloacimonadota bacterium]MDD4559979.1 endonuclease/exonuclease/phosphatase family protein [Candidatus Cloacimonadota bacterium]